MVPRIDTMNNKVESLIIKEANNRASMINLEVYMGHFIQMLHARNQGMLPSNLELNHMMVGISVMLRY